MTASSAEPSPRARHAASESKGSRSRALSIGVGAAEIVLGLIAIIWPLVAAVSIAILLGTLLLIEGGIALVAAFAARGWQLFGRLVVSVVSGLAGIYLLAYPDEGVVGLTIVLVILMFVAGVSLLANGLLGDDNRGMLILVGTLDIVVGVLIWTNLPSSASWAVGLLVGLHFLARGIETASYGVGEPGRATRLLGGEKGLIARA